MPDPQVGGSTVGANSQPIYNGQAPKQPKALPLVFNFTAQNTYNVDLSVQQQFNTIDFVQSVFIDNSTGTAPIVLTCPVTRQAIQCPPKSQGYFPFLQTVPIQFTVSSTGGQPAAIIELMNFPVAAMVWSIGSAAFAFNGAGALQVSDTLLEALIANNGLTVTTQPGFNYIIFEGQKRTYSVATGPINIGATGTAFQLTGAPNPTITRVNFIEINGVSLTAADSAKIWLARASTSSAGTSSAPVIAKHDSADIAPGAIATQYTLPGAPGTLVAYLRNATLPLPLNTSAGLDSIRWDFTTRNDKAIVLRGNAEFLRVDFQTYSGSYLNNLFEVTMEWTEE